MKSQRQGRLAGRLMVSIGITILVATFVVLFPTSLVPSANADRPGTGLDTCAPGVQFLGFSEDLDKTSFGGFTVAELSGITYDQHNGRYYAVADRAGAVQTHYFTLNVPLGAESLGAPTIEDVTVLKNASGTGYNGFSFDAEGVVTTHQKQLIIASEGGSGGAAGVQQPEVRRFSFEGDELESVLVPARFLIGTNNLSFESLAISPNGQSLFTANEGPLPAVGTAPADGQASGFRGRIRILRYERGPDGFVPAEQYFYLADPGRTAGDVGVVEIIALSESDLLVLERGFAAPPVVPAGNTVKVYRVSLEGAEDVSDEPTLAAAGLTPLAKTFVFDLANCPDDGATIPPGATQPNALLDNFEAMSLGPHLPGGRRALILLSDDNFGSNQTTRLIALALSTNDLVGND